MNNETIKKSIGKIMMYKDKGYVISFDILADILETLLDKEEEPKEEKKPIFTFENHDYHEGDNVYWFDKNNYAIRNCLISSPFTSNDEGSTTSKIYPSESLCKEALNEWIWENHKISEKERRIISIKWNFGGVDDHWKDFYCSEIIKQKTL